MFVDSKWLAGWDYENGLPIVCDLSPEQRYVVVSDPNEARTFAIYDRGADGDTRYCLPIQGIESRKVAEAIRRRLVAGEPYGGCE